MQDLEEFKVMCRDLEEHITPHLNDCFNSKVRVVVLLCNIANEICAQPRPKFALLECIKTLCEMVEELQKVDK